MSDQNTPLKQKNFNILLNQIEMFQKQYTIQQYDESTELMKDRFLIDLKYWIKKIENAKSQNVPKVSLKNALINFTDAEAFQNETPIKTAEVILLFLNEQLKSIEKKKSQEGLPRLRKNTRIPLGSTTKREILLAVAEQLPEIAQLSNEEQLKYVDESEQNVVQFVKGIDPSLYTIDTNTHQALIKQQIKENEEGYIKLMKLSQETLKAIENASINLPHQEKVKIQQQSVNIQIRLSEYRKWFAELNLQPPTVNLIEQEKSKSSAEYDENTQKIEGEFLSVDELQIRGETLLRIYYQNPEGETLWTEFNKGNTYFISKGYMFDLQAELKKGTTDREKINTYKILALSDKILADYLRKDDLKKYFTHKKINSENSLRIDTPEPLVVKVGNKDTNAELKKDNDAKFHKKLISEGLKNEIKTKSKKSKNKTELSGIYFQKKKRHEELINEFIKKQGEYGSVKYANEIIAKEIWKEHQIRVTPKAVSTAMRYK